jgi:hypothetical protein
MIIVAIFNVLVVAIASVENSKGDSKGLKAAFLMIFTFLALRYDYGNDYMAYAEIFASTDKLDLASRIEPGWQLLCLMCRPAGFFVMVAALAGFNCLVYYSFVKKYVSPEYFGFAVFMYVFNPYFMLVHLSAMRQALAVSLFVLAVDYLVQRRPLRYALVIAVASTFHASALFLLPVYILVWLNRSLPNVAVMVLLALYAAALAFGSQVDSATYLIGESLGERYGVYQERAVLTIGLGFVFYSACLALILFMDKAHNRTTALIVKLAALSYFASAPLGLAISAAGRMGMYFGPALIVAIPQTARAVRDKRHGVMFLAADALITLYEFQKFFESDIWIGKYEAYRSILSAPQWL